MTYQTQPWTLDEKKIGTGATKMSMPIFKEEMAVSTARVTKLFEQNKNVIYTNRDLAFKLGLSEGTISCITSRLQATGTIKIVEVHSRVSAYSMGYQHKEGPSQGVPRLKGYDGKQKDAAVLVQELFEENINAVFTKAEVIEKLKGRASKGHVEESIKILLLIKVIKVIDDFENKTLKLQSYSGNKKGINVLAELDEEHMTLRDFIKQEHFSEKEKAEALNKLPKTCELFYSNRSLTKVYLKKDLERCKRKGILGGLFN